jgi:hypothetical protein
VDSFDQRTKSFWGQLRDFNKAKAFDNYVNEITDGSPYYAYIDMMHMYQRLLISNSGCTGFSFFEEGMSGYVSGKSFEELTQMFWMFEFRNKLFSKAFWESLKYVISGYSLRMLSMPYLPQAYSMMDGVKYYCFSTDAYPGVALTKLVKYDLSLINKHDGMGANFNAVDFEGDILWIEDSFYFHYDMDVNFYKQALRLGIEQIKSEYPEKKVSVKLRPNQLESDSPVIEVLRELNLNYRLLNDAVVLESLLLFSKDNIVVGNVSALLFYASVFGHKSFSIFDFIPHKPSSPYDGLEVFWNKVERLK